MTARGISDRVIDAVGERYFTVDTRVLAMFRVGMGVVLLVDVLRRLPFAAMFYSDGGVLPSELAQSRPWGDEVVSLFFWLKTPREAQLGMLALAVVYLFYLVGYKTRAAQILAFVGFASLNARNVFVENRGHVEMSLALMWTLWLPLGERCSIDAWRRSGPRPKKRVKSLAVFAITIQIAAIYALNALQKEGAAWQGGQAVHYVLWQNRIATDFAGWLRMHEPAWFSPVMTTATLWGEGLAALLVSSPVAQRPARNLFLCITLGIHGGIALTMNLWPHSYIIMLLNLLMLPAATLDSALRRPMARRLRRWAARTGLAAMRSSQGGGARSAQTASLAPYAVAAREGFLAIMLVAVLHRIGHDNHALPDLLRPTSKGGLAPLIAYPRLHQRWSMFAEAPLTDGTIVVDAVTVGGERIDPLTGRLPDLDAPLHGPFGQSQLECDYYLKIQRADFVVYRAALRDYLARWHELEGRPAADELVSFKIYWVSNDAPAPGSATPTNIRRRLLIAQR